MQDIKLLNLDARVGFNMLEDNSIDLVFTDPPYLKDYLWTYSLLSWESNRVLKPGGHCVAYSGNVHLPEALKRMSNDLNYRTIITLVHKDGHGTVWNKRILSACKPVLVFTKGRLLQDSNFLVNLYQDKGASKQYHTWGQNIAFAMYMIKLLTKKGDTVLDPFLGGGTTAKACQILKRKCVGFEIDQEAFASSERRLKEYSLDSFDPLVSSGDLENNNNKQ